MSENLTLNIKSDDEITLPAAIGASDLSLAEIGAIVIFACMVELQIPGDDETYTARMRQRSMKRAMNKLVKKGIFVTKVKDGAISINIDLDVAIGDAP